MENVTNTAQQEILEFKKNRQQLLAIGAQKQQMQAQQMALKDALTELTESKEKKVYKAIGNILILKDSTVVKKELEETVEKIDLRVKTMQKQEDALIGRLNKLKSSIEKVMAPAAGESASLEGEATVAKTEKESKKKK